MKRTLFALLLPVFLGSLSITVYAQGRDDSAPENAIPRPMISPSPEAASLGKYGDIPVGLFKGMPNIDIPLYTLSKGSISIPMSINYSSNGVRVNDISTTIGLGWTLMAGGVVTSSAVDKDDLNQGSSRTLPFDPMNFNPNSGNNASPDYIFAKLYTSGRSPADLQPDILTYNFGGRSGKFFLDNDLHTGHTIPASAVKIFRDTSGYTITDEKGTKFKFATKELSIVEDSCTIGSGPRNDSSFGATSYYLTQITDSKGNQVNLTYENVSYYYSAGIEEAQYVSTSNSSLAASCPILDSHNSKCIKVQTVMGKRIKTISTADNSVSVTFIYSTIARQDIVTLPGSANVVGSLDQVVIRAGPKIIKTVSMSHDYFKSSGYATAPNNAQKALQCRLKLTSVTEPGKMPYSFFYNEKIGMPARLSEEVDYWGYSKGTGGALIPAYPDISFYSGGNLEPNSDVDQTGILTKIKYPTGGSTTLFYEQNDNYSYEDVGGNATHTLGCVTDVHTPHTCVVHLDYAIQATIFYHLKPGDQHDDGSAVIDGPGGLHLEFGGNGSYATNLPAGDYTIDLDNSSFTSRTSVTFSWTQYVPNMQWVRKQMGGVRIRKTIDSAGIGLPVSKFYSYLLSDTSTHITSLFYKHIVPQNYSYPYNTSHVDENTGTVVNCSYSVMHAAPIPMIGKGDRSDYGYGKVTVLTDSLGMQGKSVHYYSSSITDFVPNGVTGITDRTWLEGMELGQDDYLYNPATQRYVISKRSRNTYKLNLSAGYLGDNTSPSRPPNQYSLYAFGLTESKPEFGSGLNVSPASFRVERYPVVSAWVYLSKTDDTVFNTTDTTKFTATTTSCFFDNATHQQPTRTVAATSDGGQITSITTYPDDYAPGTAFIDDMQSAHQIGMPIEKVSYRNNGTTTNIVSGSIARYLPGGKGLLDRIYGFESLAPVALSSFKFSDRASGQLPYGTSPAAFAADAHYQLKATYNSYDVQGNVLTMTPTYGGPVSYIWNCNKDYPVAMVANSDSLDIAYTSFEPGEKGHWIFDSLNIDTTTAKTGKSSYYFFGEGDSGFIKSLPISASKTYVVSYWSTSPSSSYINGAVPSYTVNGSNVRGWYYHEHRITGATVILLEGSGNIDELRLYPLSAQMTTYTIDPLVGVTSSTDAKGLTTYYEYDSFQRLLNVKDELGNILKRYDYNYAPITAIWIDFGSAQCVQGTNGNTGEQQIQQKDTNPYSLTYNQLRWRSLGTNTTSCPIPVTYYSVAKSGTYARNNCGTNYIGSSVIYTVPANAYSSTISQADADSKATNAVTANGQNYANANGTCTASCTGNAYKVINNICEQGVRVNTSSVKVGSSYKCTYHYEWSNGTVSTDYTETNPQACAI